MAAYANLYIDQGATFKTVLTLENEDGTPLDLTGWVTRSKMKRSYTSWSGQIIVTFTVTVIDAMAGQVQLSLTATETAAIKAQRYFYDVEIFNSVSGEVKRVMDGIVTVNPEVTT